MEIPQVVAGIYVSPIGIVIVARSKQRSKGETFGAAGTGPSLQSRQWPPRNRSSAKKDSANRHLSILLLHRLAFEFRALFPDLRVPPPLQRFSAAAHPAKKEKELDTCYDTRLRSEGRKEGRKLEWNRSSGEVIFAFNPGRRSGGRRAKGRKSAQVHSDAVVHVVLDRRRTAH